MASNQKEEPRHRTEEATAPLPMVELVNGRVNPNQDEAGLAREQEERIALLYSLASCNMVL